MYSLEELEMAFHNWLSDYEVSVTMRWDELMPQEWQALTNAQWVEFQKSLSDAREFSRPLDENRETVSIPTVSWAGDKVAPVGVVTTGITYVS